MRIFGLFFCFALFCFSAGAHSASELEKIFLEKKIPCNTFVQIHDNLVMVGFGRYKMGLEEPRLPISAKIRVYDLHRELEMASEIQTADAALDMALTHSRGWILTYSGLEEWTRDFSQRLAIHSTWGGPGDQLFYKQHAMGMVLVGEQIWIAHGRLGITVFDINKKTITQTFQLLNDQRPLESMATGILLRDGKVFVAFDNFSPPLNEKPAFRGWMIFDPATFKLLSKAEGMDPGVSHIFQNKQFIFASVNGHALWKYSPSESTISTIKAGVGAPIELPDLGVLSGLPWAVEDKFLGCLKVPPKKGEGKFYKPELRILSLE